MLEQKIDVVISTNVNFFKETEIGINFIKIVEIVRRREGDENLDHFIWQVERSLLREIFPRRTRP